jgi:glutamate racemase
LFGDTLCQAEIEQTIDHICALSKNKTHIVLGCTHYVHLKPQIEASTGLIVTDGNVGVAKQVKRLASAPFFGKKPTQKFMLSSKNKMLAKKYRKIFDQTLANITKL